MSEKVEKSRFQELLEKALTATENEGNPERVKDNPMQRAIYANSNSPQSRRSG